MSLGKISGRPLRCVGAALLTLAVAGGARASLLSDSISVSGDSISRAFDANTSSCNYGDNASRNWSSGDDHGSSFCSTGGDGTYSQAERLECAKGANVTVFNDAVSGADMLSDFFNQASSIRSHLSSAPAPHLVSVFLGHNDACTNTQSKTGNGCSGDRDPNNYCRTTNAAFEREFRRGLDQLIQIPSSRIAVLATARISELCNFQSKNGCGVSFGLPCDIIWGLGSIAGNVFGAGGICASLTSDCSDQRRIDMYNTLVGYNEILERVTAEYAAIPPGGASATGAVKAIDVELRYWSGAFYYKFQSGDVSCCDCFHPSDQGQAQLAEFAWDGLQCGVDAQCCGDSGSALGNARCDTVDTWSSYPGGFWANGVVCGNGVVDPGEQCDDGNTDGGDCCSSTCQFESGGNACADDGNACTDDVCDGAGACTHPAANGVSCDDGVFCNGDDVCSGGACSGHAGDPCALGLDCADTCNEAGRTCLDPAGTPCDDDGNLCTSDVCNGGGSCVHPPNSAPCDDGVFCNGADFCAGGTCSQHSGDPCAGGADCADTCNEGPRTCFAPAGTGCADDGNACTDDRCDGSGACAHPANGAPCDDGDACTTGDTCAGGTCVGGAPPLCAPCQVCEPESGCSGTICTPTPTAVDTPTPTPIATPTATPTATATPRLCPDAPRPGCRTAEKSLLLLDDKDGGRHDRVLWKFVRGQSTSQADFGEPTATTDYALCIYDAADRILRLDVGADFFRWRPSGDRGWTYKDRSGSQAGVQKIRLKGSDRDHTVVLLKGKGENTPAMSLGSLPAPITVQLTNGDTPVCWEAVYSAGDISRNEADRLKAAAR